MWETYNHLEQSLVADGTAAKAEVLAAECVARGGIRYANLPKDPWVLKLRVTPENGPPFEVELKMQIDARLDATQGNVLEVLYDPKDPQRMVIDPRSTPASNDEFTAMQLASRYAAQGVEGLDPSAGAEAVDAAGRAAVAARLNATMAESLKDRKAAMPNIPAQIEKVHELYLAGKLNEQEYETAKKGLLDRL